MALSDSLVAGWIFNDDFTDAVGSSHLTQHGGVTRVPGKVGNAASFNGLNQYLDVADNAALSIALGQPFTISLWLYPTSLVNGATPLNKGSVIFGAANFEYAIEFLASGPDTNVVFLVSYNAGLVSVSGGVLATNAWSHVVAWYDTTFINIQVNNGVVVQQSGPNGTSDQAHALNFGSSGAGGAFYPGLIDIPLIWKRVLTSGERSQLWNGGAGREPPFGGGIPPHLFQAGILASV